MVIEPAVYMFGCRLLPKVKFCMCTRHIDTVSKGIENYSRAYTVQNRTNVNDFAAARKFLFQGAWEVVTLPTYPVEKGRPTKYKFSPDAAF